MNILKWLRSKEINIGENIDSRQDINSYDSKREVDIEAKCPYCKATMNKFPIRKTKCPICKKSIFIRKLNNSKIKTLVTEEQAKEDDTERKKKDLQYKGFEEVAEFGVTQEEFLKRKEELFLKQGIENNNNDVVWSIYNELLIKNVIDYNKLGMIYYSMALFLHKEGKDNFKLLQLCAKAKLDGFQSSNLEFKIQINASPDSCDNCKKTDKKILSIEEAFLLPVPCRECNHRIGFCRCYYTAECIRDSEGMIILKK